MREKTWVCRPQKKPECSNGYRSEGEYLKVIWWLVFKKPASDYFEADKGLRDMIVADGQVYTEVGFVIGKRSQRIYSSLTVSGSIGSSAKELAQPEIEIPFLVNYPPIRRDQRRMENNY